MGLLHEILDHNARFVAERERPLDRTPARKIALLACVDTRLVEFLEPALGVRRGDAVVVKSAGNVLLDPLGEGIRSLVVAIHMLGCEEVFVVGHHDCGLARVDEAQVRRRMLERGVPPEAIDALQPGLGEWLGAFEDPRANVQRAVATIRQSPLVPRDVPVHGLVIDPASGRLELVVDGYQALAT